jgi:hypothetical protein
MHPATNGHEPTSLPGQFNGHPVGINGTNRSAARRRTADEQHGIDWALVAAFRTQASDQLSAAIGGDRGLLGRAAQEELGRSIILELLASEAAESLSAGRDSWSLAEQDGLAEAASVLRFVAGFYSGFFGRSLRSVCGEGASIALDLPPSFCRNRMIDFPCHGLRTPPCERVKIAVLPP